MIENHVLEPWILKVLERRAGIEPASLAWKAKVLPLHKRRIRALLTIEIDTEYLSNKTPFGGNQGACFNHFTTR